MNRKYRDVEDCGRKTQRKFTLKPATIDDVAALVR